MYGIRQLPRKGNTTQRWYPLLARQGENLSPALGGRDKQEEGVKGKNGDDNLVDGKNEKV